ncbi:DUF4145 domain-containing protein [Paenibacillus yanchengensis]|uniref:DUF4145 domain-containing protein n=1 Tax=Paenibacillus yanchengensis TaxID=2035833 RepID=A0ABW4YLR3_9BACL
MAGFTCPFCRRIMSENSSTLRIYQSSFYLENTKHQQDVNITLVYHKCPGCDKTCVYSIGSGVENIDIVTPLFPQSFAIQFPDYIPKPIRSDYEEACAIVNLSPKASATLSRRCLQGMIRDFWNISKKRLVDEMDELKNLVPAAQWRVIDGIRRIGNIGAHMEKDVNLIIDIQPEEATKLIKLIELLIEQWYIQRHEQVQLYAEIIQIDESKRVQRNKT